MLSIAMLKVIATKLSLRASPVDDELRLENQNAGGRLNSIGRKGGEPQTKSARG